MIVRDAQVDARRVTLPIPVRGGVMDPAPAAGDPVFEQRVAEEVERRLADAMAEMKRHTAEHARTITAQGYRDGFAEGRQELEQDARQLEQLAQTLQESRAAMLQRLEEHCAALAFAIASKVVGEGVLSGQLIAAWVRQALAELKHRPLRIRLNPDDLRLLDTVAPGLRDQFDGADTLLWIADERFERGGGCVESDEEALDIGLKNQLERLAEALRNGRGFTP